MAINKRLHDLKAALREDENACHDNRMSTALRRVLRLLELCPWLQEDEKVTKPKREKTKSVKPRIAQ